MISISDLKEAVTWLQRNNPLKLRLEKAKLEISSLGNEEELAKAKRRILELESLLEKEALLHSQAQKVRFNGQYCYVEGDEHPQCPRCWEANKKPIHMTQPISWNGGIKRVCPECKYTVWEQQPSPAIAIVSSPRSSWFDTRGY